MTPAGKTRADRKAPRARPAALHLVLFASIIAVPLLLLLGAMLYRSTVQEHERLERLIGQELDELTAAIDRDIERRLAVLQTLATSPALASEDWSAFYLQAKASLGRNYLVLVDATGRQLVNTYVPYGQAPAFTANPATVESMRRAMRPFVSDLFTSLVTRSPVYNVSIPIAGDRGLRYVMSLGLFPEDLLGLLRDQHLDAGWTTVVWDRTGTIMARSRDHATWLGKKVPGHWRTQPIGQAVEDRSMEGERVLAVSGRMAQAGWTVRVSFPAKVIDAQTHQLLWVWGAAVLLVTVLTAVTAYIFGATFTRPLGAAARAAAAMGRGDPVEVSDTRIAEVNAVNRALREAAAELDSNRAALRQSELLLGTAADVAQFGAHQYDAVNDRVIRSPQIRRILGVGTGEDSGLDAALAFIHPDDRNEIASRKREILASEQQYQLTYRIRRPDGEVRWVMDRGQVERDGAGKALRVVGVLVDITDLKVVEQRQRLLFDELNHRVKNTLAIVQSLAQQTRRSTPDPEQFTRAFGERIMSMSRAHDLLARTAWQGAPLQEVVSAVLAPFDAPAGRIAIGGDAVELPASITITFALLLNELATNAAKYGALSVDAGRIGISWTVAPAGDGLMVDLVWQERDGPRVVPPTRRGFGSRLLAASAQQIKGELNARFEPDGLRCQIRFPVPAANIPPQSSGEVSR
jgi:PAS domain S-box-containing protein